MINTSIGDACIEWGDEKFCFHPSFFSMQRLGEPKDIEDCAELALSGYYRARDLGVMTRSEFWTCLHILGCCETNEREISEEIYGYYDENGVFHAGSEPVVNLGVIAWHLVNIGINGEPSERMKKLAKIRKKDTEREPFNPIEYVASAVAHLGMNQSDAWQLTMIEFQRAMESKFPPSQEDQKRLDSMMTPEESKALIKRIADAKRNMKGNKQTVRFNGKRVK